MADKYNHKELKLKVLGYGIYLGTIWWNTSGPKQYRWHRRCRVHRLVDSKGTTFWDRKYWT